MSISKAERPIGIFDSGIGGLTVAHAVKKALPHEDIVYFGDTAHLPYGDKSSAAIQAYSVKICDVLLQHQCKLILIACNSASAAAFELVKEYVGSKALVLNVIDPVVSYVYEKYAQQTIGLIGTKKTVKSNVYRKKLDQKLCSIELRSLATPLLVPMIEEGFYDNKISEKIIESYLSNAMFENIQALILGCTHYPLIKKEIDTYFQKKIEIIDSSEIVAENVKIYLQNEHLSHWRTEEGNIRCFVSDYTKSFEETTKIFFRESVSLEHYPLWE